MTRVEAREGALMPQMRAPFSLRSRIIARSLSFDSITSSRKAFSRASIASPRGSAASILATLSLTFRVPRGAA